MEKTYYQNIKIVRYRGDMTNGEFHGQGKLYYPNGLTEYSGSFIKNKLDGNGILYYPNGNIRYSGEFSNNKANGIGRVYNSDGMLLFEGMFKDHYWYEGELKDNKPNGKGKLYFVDMDYSEITSEFIKELNYFKNIGLRYEGNFVDGKFHGSGTLYICRHNFKFDENSKTYKYMLNEITNVFPNNQLPFYSGEFADGMFDGTGELYEYNQEQFENLESNNKLEKLILYSGHFKNNYPHGLGTLYYKVYEQGIHHYFTDEDDVQHISQNIITRFSYSQIKLSNNYSRCEGEFVNGILTNAKVFNTSNILKYLGQIDYGDFHGNGTYYNNDGTIKYSGTFNQNTWYLGEQLNGKFHGKGKIYQDGIIIFDGNFSNGLKHGTGTDYYLNGKIKYSGDFSNGLAHGQGKQYDFCGYLVYSGEFSNNNFNKQDKQYNLKRDKVLLMKY